MYYMSVAAGCSHYGRFGEDAQHRSWGTQFSYLANYRGGDERVLIDHIALIFGTMATELSRQDKDMSLNKELMKPPGKLSDDSVLADSDITLEEVSTHL